MFFMCYLGSNNVQDGDSIPSSLHAEWINGIDNFGELHL